MARVVSSQTILGGRKRISGTRISVDLIYNYVRDGKIDQLKKDYPHLTNRQVEVVLRYLDQQLRQARGHFVATNA